MELSRTSLSTHSGVSRLPARLLGVRVGGVVRVVLNGSQRGLDPLPRARQVGLAQPRETLATFPERERLLERKAARLEFAHDLHQLVPGLLVAEACQVVGGVATGFAHVALRLTSRCTRPG